MYYFLHNIREVLASGYKSFAKCVSKNSLTISTKFSPFLPLCRKVLFVLGNQIESFI